MSDITKVLTSYFPRALGFLCLVLLTNFSIGSEIDDPLISVKFKGRLLTEILTDFETEGYSFVYSSDLVNRNLVVSRVPGGYSPEDKLQHVLQGFGLSMEPYPVSSDTRSTDKPPSSASMRPQRRWFIVPLEDKGAWMRGTITDAHSSLPLSDVKLEVGDQFVLTNSRGEFNVRLPSTQAFIKISRNGYHKQKLKKQEMPPSNIVIPLNPIGIMEEVIISASRYSLKKQNHGADHVMDTHDIESLPELGDDALRGISYLPGTASNGLSAQPYIRGGADDETLILFNDIELLEPFHLKDFQSLFSGLNPNLIKSIDVYTGGFPARYGDRMSGVIDIDPLEELPGMGGEISISLLTTSASAYGLLDNNKGHWALSARRGNLDFVTNKVNPTLGKPSYSDWYGQLGWNLSPDSKLDAGVLVYNDDIVLSELEAGEENPDSLEGEYAFSQYDNAYGWLQWSYVPDDELTMTTTISAGRISNKRDGTINVPDEITAQVSDIREFKVYSLSHRVMRSFSETLSLDLGGRLNYQRALYRYQSDIQRGLVAELFNLNEEAGHDIEVKPSGFSGGVYASTRYTPNPLWSIESGLRLDFQGFGKGNYRHQVSPRLNVRWDLTPDTLLKTSFGRFYQPEGIHELQITDGLSHYQLAQYTDTVILGVEHHFYTPEIKLRAEAFYKRIENPKLRFENALNPLELLPELMDDRIRVDPSQAKVSGVEITASYNPSPDFKAWLSYAQSKAQDLIGDQWERRTWDQSETLGAGLLLQYQDWTFSAALRWHTGWQTTLLPEHLESLDDSQPRRNQGSLGEFSSLDLRISRIWEWEQQSFMVYFEASNAMNHINRGGVELDIEELDDGSFDLGTEDEELLPVVPSLGFQWRFGQ